jgi:hypothetical protein
MANRGSRKVLGATDSGLKPSAYPLGSWQSRAAARAMLVARKADELRFEAVSILDGSRLNLDGLAEALRAARMRNRAGELPAALPATGGSDGRRRADCLSERIARARERARRMQDPETTH